MCETGTVKFKAWKQKKQKVFEFSTESQIPKQNGKKYNQEYYNKKVLNKKMRKLKKKAIWISHLTQQSFINSLSKQWLVLEQNWHWNNIQSFRKSTHSNVFLYSIFQPSWGAWQPIWFVPRPQYQAASVDFMPAMPRPSPRAHPKSLVVHRPRPPAPPLPRPSFAKSTMPSFANAF